MNSVVTSVASIREGCIPTVVAVVVALTCLPAARPAAQSKAKAPDGTVLVCNFTWTLLAGNGPGDSRDCGGYHFVLIRAGLGVEFDTLTISESGSDRRST